MDTPVVNPPLKKKRKSLKILLWTMLALLLMGGGLWAWLHFGDFDKRDPFTVIPDDAIFVIETSNLTEGWKTLSDSRMWRHMMGTKFFSDIDQDAMSLDSLIKGNKTMDMLFSGRKLLISAHMIKPDDYDFLFAVDMKKASKVTWLKDYIGDLVSSFGFEMRTRDFQGTEITMLEDLTSPDVLSLAFIDNVLVCSYAPALVEKSIQQKDSAYWEKNESFRAVASELDDETLFTFYLNYKQLYSYLTCYMDDPGESMLALGSILSHTALNINFEEERLRFNGYTGVVTSEPSYFNALRNVKPGPMKALSVVSNRAALYVAICFDDFNEFYENLRTEFDAEDTTRAKNYDKTIRKAEKFLKVNLEEDFFGWIGNEITFVKMEPSSNAREEDVVVTIHARDINAATAGLHHITSQVRKKTAGLVKFKDTEYKNFTIQYLGFSGLLKMFFGPMFNKIERPYFTFVEDFVVMSNSPSLLMDIIDDYTMGRTLARDEAFMEFIGDFDKTSNVSAFVQLPKIYQHLYYYSKGDKRKGIRDNKDVILGFDLLGFQLSSDDEMFKTTFIANFDEDAVYNDELERIELAAEELFVADIDTGIFRIKTEMLEGLPDGVTRITYPESDKIRFEGRLLNGKPEGLWRVFYESGKIAGAVNYVNGLAAGEALYYYDNEQQTTRAEVTYVEDLIDGVYREFYENGARKASVGYQQGKPHGEAEFYYDSGIPKIEGRYDQGLKTGKWIHFTETGDVMDKAKWKKEKKGK